MKRDFFRLVYDSRSADFTIDWSGRGLGPKTLGVAKLAAGSVIDGIVMRRKRNEPRVCETLVQELGHLLGLDHSDEKNDIMYGYAHPHWHPSLKYVEVTARDLSALWWLYSRREYVAIVPRRSANR